MVVSLFWSYFLHPIKAWKKDRLGFVLLVASHVIKPALFVVFGGTSFLRGYMLMTAAYWITSEDSVVTALLSCSGSTAKQGQTEGRHHWQGIWRCRKHGIVDPGAGQANPTTLQRAMPCHAIVCMACTFPRHTVCPKSASIFRRFSPSHTFITLRCSSTTVTVT